MWHVGVSVAFDLGPFRRIPISCVTGLYDGSSLGFADPPFDFHIDCPIYSHQHCVRLSLYIIGSIHCCLFMKTKFPILIKSSQYSFKIVHDIKILICSWFSENSVCPIQTSFFLCTIHNSKISICGRVVKSSEKQFATISLK